MRFGLPLDIQATRSAAAAGAAAIISPPVRLYSISIASDGGGAGVLELTTTFALGVTGSKFKFSKNILGNPPRDVFCQTFER